MKSCWISPCSMSWKTNGLKNWNVHYFLPDLDNNPSTFFKSWRTSNKKNVRIWLSKNVPTIWVYPVLLPPSPLFSPPLELFFAFQGDHPYITSAHFWTFSNPPTLRQHELYSCKNITRTSIQISRLFLFWLFLQN